MFDRHNGNGDVTDDSFLSSAPLKPDGSEDPPLSAVVVAAINELGTCIEELGSILPRVQGDEPDTNGEGKEGASTDQQVREVAKRLELCAEALRNASRKDEE